MNLIPHGIQIELLILLVVHTIAISAFSKFAEGLSLFQRVIKRFVIDAIIVGLYFLIGHWSIIFIALALIPGTVFHVMWCKKNGIDPIHATPRKKYYALRGRKIED